MTFTGISWCITSFAAGGLVQLFIGDRKLRKLSRRVDELTRIVRCERACPKCQKPTEHLAGMQYGTMAYLCTICGAVHSVDGIIS